MAFPSLVEIKSNIAVKEPGSAPVTENSAPTPDAPSIVEDTGADTGTPTETASAEPEQDAPSVESQDAATPEEAGDPDRIPYTRFKEKVDQVNTLKETNGLLEQQIQTFREAQSAVEAAPEPEEVDPFLERLESLDEYDSDSDMVSVMKDMAQELKTLRAQASKSEQGVQQIRVAEQIQRIEAEITGITGEMSIHDQDAARIFILQNLSQNPKQDMKALADQFAGWEKGQEEAVLKRLGVSRPDASSKEAKAAEPDVPPRPAHAGNPEPSGEGKPKRSVTLKDLRKTLGAGRRR